METVDFHLARIKNKKISKLPIVPTLCKNFGNLLIFLKDALQAKDEDVTAILGELLYVGALAELRDVLKNCGINLTDRDVLRQALLQLSWEGYGDFICIEYLHYVFLDIQLDEDYVQDGVNGALKFNRNIHKITVNPEKAADIMKKFGEREQNHLEFPFASSKQGTFLAGRGASRVGNENGIGGSINGGSQTTPSDEPAPFQSKFMVRRGGGAGSVGRGGSTTGAPFNTRADTLYNPNVLTVRPKAVIVAATRSESDDDKEEGWSKVGATSRPSTNSTPSDNSSSAMHSQLSSAMQSQLSYNSEKSLDTLRILCNTLCLEAYDQAEYSSTMETVDFHLARIKNKKISKLPIVPSSCKNFGNLLIFLKDALQTKDEDVTAILGELLYVGALAALRDVLKNCGINLTDRNLLRGALLELSWEDYRHFACIECLHYIFLDIEMDEDDVRFGVDEALNFSRNIHKIAVNPEKAAEIMKEFGGQKKNHL